MPPNQTGNALPTGYMLGEYKIQSVLGIGGFGVTYKAHDTKLDSEVAIKEYFPQAFAVRSQDATQTIRAKASGFDNYQWGLKEFVKEAQALAKFKHNYIVRVLRFMEANGTAYMIMEYEEGESLGDLLKRTGGFLKEADLLKVFIPVLSGLQAVHDAGLLHLDIKPDNIYLRTDGTPMLIDFGSARQSKGNNGDQRVALTPAYSALEQYPTINREPGPWSDVYSMAATIYTCITGKPPTDVMKRYDTMKRKYPDPLAPATSFERPRYAQHIRETLVHAMELDPKKRPQSAIALQKALMGQSLEEAKEVKKPSAAFNSGFIGVRKAVTRDTEEKKGRGFFEKLFLTLVIVPAIAVFSVEILIRSNVITRAEVYGHIDQIISETTRVATATEQELKRTLRLDDSPSIYEQAPVISAAQISERKKTLPAFTPQRELEKSLVGHKGNIVQLAFLPNGELLASVSADGKLNLWNLQSGKVIKSISNPKDSFGAFAISRDGTLLAKTTQHNNIAIYNLVKNEFLKELTGHQGAVNQLVFTPDNKHLVSVSDDRSLSFWDIDSGKTTRRIDDFVDSVLTVDISPSGSLMVTGDGSGKVKHWSSPSVKKLVDIQANKVDEEITSASFSPDGKWIATGGSASFLKLWNTGLEQSDIDLSGALSNVYSVTFSHDGKWLLSGGSGGLVIVHDIETGEIAHRIKTGNKSVYTVAVSHDGKWVATAGESRSIKLWRAPSN